MIYVMTTGSHESYSVFGVYSCEQPVGEKQLAKQWAAEFPEKATKLGDCRNGKEYFDDAHFRQYVINKCKLETVEYQELWLPDYSLDMQRWVKE